MLVAEGMHRNFLTSHRQARQPIEYKQAQVLPLLKKAGLDRSSPENYRPISNVSTVLKIIERLVLTRLRPRLLESANFSKYLSAYRRDTRRKQRCWRFSTECTAADDKQVTVLISLDLSAAFDTVDHEVLLQRLQPEFGVTDTPIFWLCSYLESPTQFVKLGQHQLPAVGPDVGVPQRSVLGPLLFAVYCSPAANVIVFSYNNTPTTNSSVSPCLLTTHDGLSVLAACTADVREWYLQNGLQLNRDKSGGTDHWHC